MPNVFTRIPDGEPPRLPRVVDVIVPLADLFMILMVSRPASGSLRRTWVTPASLGLSAVTCLAMVVLLAVIVPGMTGAGAVAAAVVALVVCAGSAAVTAVGLTQRLAA